MPPRDKGATARAGGRGGTFDAMYSRAGKGVGSAWAKPRPDLHAVVAEDDERDLAPVLPRVLDGEAVERLYDALDYVAPTLRPNDRAVYVLMVRRSYGAGRATCLVNLPLFTELASMSMSGLQYVIRRLKDRGLIEAQKKRGGRQPEQGIEYRVNVPKK